MDICRIGSLAVMALIVLAFCGCASGRARTVDCERRAAPINEHPLVGAQGRPTKPTEEAR
jgi:hypothetical protein